MLAIILFHAHGPYAWLALGRRSFIFSAFFSHSLLLVIIHCFLCSRSRFSFASLPPLSPFRRASLGFVSRFAFLSLFPLPFHFPSAGLSLQLDLVKAQKEEEKVKGSRLVDDMAALQRQLQEAKDEAEGKAEAAVAQLKAAQGTVQNITALTEQVTPCGRLVDRLLMPCWQFVDALLAVC
jgi:hypothetical protein